MVHAFNKILFNYHYEDMMVCMSLFFFIIIVLMKFDGMHVAIIFYSHSVDKV